MSHTPGPWTTAGLLAGTATIRNPLWEGNSQPIARIHRRLSENRNEDGSHAWLDDEANANARLIAAAPDLLEACEAALSDLSARDAVHYHGDTTVTSRLRSAIAKATGSEVANGN